MKNNVKIQDDTQSLQSCVSGSDDWVNLEYIGKTYEIMEGVMFKKGTKSGLPKDIWENIKDDESMKFWVVI